MIRTVPAPAREDAATAEEAVVQVVTPLRVGLHRALRLRAAEEGTTIRALVLRGLRAIGLPVEDADEADRRGARGNRRPRRVQENRDEVGGRG